LFSFHNSYISVIVFITGRQTDKQYCTERQSSVHEMSLVWTAAVHVRRLLASTDALTLVTHWSACTGQRVWSTDHNSHAHILTTTTEKSPNAFYRVRLDRLPTSRATSGNFWQRVHEHSYRAVVTLSSESPDSVIELWSIHLFHHLF